MATVLEAVPRRARGIVAGFTQQGFAAGYLLASGLHLAMSEYNVEARFVPTLTDCRSVWLACTLLVGCWHHDSCRGLPILHTLLLGTVRSYRRPGRDRSRSNHV